MPALSCSLRLPALRRFGLMGLEQPVLWSIDVGGPIINLLLSLRPAAVLALLLSYAVGPRPVAYATRSRRPLILRRTEVEFAESITAQSWARPTTGASNTLLDRVSGVGVVLLGIGILFNSPACAAGLSGRHRLTI